MTIEHENKKTNKSSRYDDISAKLIKITIKDVCKPLKPILTNHFHLVLFQTI